MPKPTPTKRPWIKLDLAYYEQDTIATLEDEFGAVGSKAMLVILLQAKTADLSGRPPSEQGILDTRVSALARTLRAAPEVTSAIVSRCVDLGLLEYLPGTDPASGRLVVRSLKRGGWEARDATAAARKARSRARQGQPDDEMNF